MANISTLLTKIKSAIYGKDMRQSLHDAIKKTNDDLNEFKNTKAQANGLASLGADGKIPDEQMPDLSIVDSYVVNSETAMLALNVQKGDFAIRTDINQLFLLNKEPASVLSNWHKFGIIVLDKSNIGLGNVDNTADKDKPISTAQQEAIDNLSDTVSDISSDVGFLKSDVRGFDTELSDIKNGGVTIKPNLSDETEYSDINLDSADLYLDDGRYGYDTLLAIAKTMSGIVHGKTEIFLSSNANIRRGLIKQNHLVNNVWDIINAFATHSIPTYLASDCGRNGGAPADDVYIIENDTDASFNYCVNGDDNGIVLSTAIPKGESRICVKLTSPQGGAEPQDGSAYVLPEDAFKAYNRGLDIPLIYTKLSYAPDASADDGEYIYITLQNDKNDPYDEYPGICFGVDNDNNPAMWFWDDIEEPRKIATDKDLANMPSWYKGMSSNEFRTKNVIGLLDANQIQWLKVAGEPVTGPTDSGLLGMIHAIKDLEESVEYLLDKVDELEEEITNLKGNT